MTVSNSKQYDDNVSFRGVRSGLFYFLIGGSIGAAVALLFAPKSGGELRSDITDIARKGYDETLDLAHNLKEQSADVYHSLKEKTDKVYDFAATKLTRAQDELDNVLETAADKINGEIREADSKLSQKSSGTGRRSSSIM